MRHSLSHPLRRPAPWPQLSRALQSTVQVVSSLASPTACSSQLNNVQQHPEKTIVMAVEELWLRLQLSSD